MFVVTLGVFQFVLAVSGVYGIYLFGGFVYATIAGTVEGEV